MIVENILESIAYAYFPKGIYETYGKQYLNSKQFSNLKDRCSYFDKNQTEWVSIKSELQALFPTLKVRDITLLSWLDRCYTLDLILNANDNEVNVISLSISIIIPFFSLTFIKNVKNLRQITNQDLKLYGLEEFQKNISILLEKYNYKIFPKPLYNYIIPDIAFKEIKQNKFTFFNAFFLNEMVNRC